MRDNDDGRTHDYGDGCDDDHGCPDDDDQAAGVDDDVVHLHLHYHVATDDCCHHDDDTVIHYYVNNDGSGRYVHYGAEYPFDVHRPAGPADPAEDEVT